MSAFVLKLSFSARGFGHVKFNSCSIFSVYFCVFSTKWEFPYKGKLDWITWWISDSCTLLYNGNYSNLFHRLHITFFILTFYSDLKHTLLKLWHHRQWICDTRGVVMRYSIFLQTHRHSPFTSVDLRLVLMEHISQERCDLNVIKYVPILFCVFLQQDDTTVETWWSMLFLLVETPWTTVL